MKNMDEKLKHEHGWIAETRIGRLYFLLDGVKNIVYNIAQAAAESMKWL